MKFLILPLFISTCWALALIGLRLPQFSKAYRSRSVFTTASTHFMLPGLDARIANDLLIEKSPLLENTRELGYQARLALNLIPDWLLVVADPFQPDFRQLVVREEVADEFTDAQMEKRMDAMTLKLRESREQFESSTRLRTVIFMEPTKIAANQLKVEFDQVSAQDSEKFGAAAGVRYMGAFAKQRSVEDNLNAAGFTTISPLDLYRDQQSHEKVLYPRAESHWSGDLEIKAAQLVIQKLAQEVLIPAGCVLNSKLNIVNLQKISFYGDLFKGLGWDESFPASHDFETQIQQYQVRRTDSKTPSVCPGIILAGSSYGVTNLSGADFSEFLQAVYLGQVENKSMAGKDGLFVLQSLKEHPPQAGSIVIWEFPFRYVKRAQ